MIRPRMRRGLLRTVAAGGASHKIVDPNAHLTWYRIEQQDEPEPKRTIRFRNQFGDNSVDTGEPRFLLVPAQKTTDPDSQFPENLDHYTCYQVDEVHTAPEGVLVDLEDQFGSQQGVPVGAPLFFCPPALKETASNPPGQLHNKEDHLAVYQLGPLSAVVEARAKDQFGEWDLRAEEVAFLAVPSEKQHVQAQ